VTLWGMPAREAGGDGAAASLDEESNDG
jgi:hypothetical protein